MKKIITLVAAIAFATTAFSQWSANFGGNVSQFTGADAKGSTKFGYQVGFTTYSDKLFSIQPGIYLINKGSNLGKMTTSLNYLQIPVNFLLGYNVSEDFRLVVGAGLYAGLGLWGREEVWDNSGLNPVLVDRKIEFFNQNDRYKALDFGWQFVIGGQWGRYGVRLGYQPSFTRVKGGYNAEKNNYSKKGPKEFNNSFMFGVSYTFGELY